MPTRFTEGDYVLGTENAELDRLGLQHAVWRPRSADAWKRAGFSTGQHIADIGCGPGFAALDLSDIVGRKGRITAVDRSPRFLEHLAARAAGDHRDNIEIVQLDLDSGALPAIDVDGAWCRWVFAFVTRPRDLLRGIRGILKPGASLVVHEYWDYSTFRLIPASPEFEEFVATVKHSWREAGGEPDIARDLVTWLPEEGFRIIETRPLVDAVSPETFTWQWPATFLEISLERLMELRYMTTERAEVVRAAFYDAERNPYSRLITPGVLEIIAVAAD